MKKIILDCDGVLLNWIDSFNAWISDLDFIKDPSEWDSTNYDIPIEDPHLAKRLIKAFNQTYHVGRLTPIPGAIKAIRTLHNEGCHLSIITAFSDRYEAIKLRERNLIALFGDVFSEITSLPVGHSKKDWLGRQDPNSYYIEDVVKHLEEGLDAGLNADNLMLIPHKYNYVDWERSCSRYCKLNRVNWTDVAYTILNK